MNKVLVTGGSGFIASHSILQLLQAGHQVRATVRSLKRESAVRSMLKQGGVEAGERLSFIETDLSADAGWEEAARGCDYVIHPASPTPATEFKHEDEAIKPAVEGVLRVLRASRAAGVKRVVLTSAFGAIGMGHAPRTAPFTEADWSNLTADVPAYQKSKTLSERAAWQFIATEGGGLELATVNPVGVLGPVLSGDYSHSIRTIHQMLNGEVPGCPKVSSCYVDVRDVADLHLRAMLSPAANGERFLATAGPSISMLDIARVLRGHFGDSAKRVPSREIPSWVLRLASLRNARVRAIVPHLGKFMNASGEKARRILGWQPRTNEAAIIATAESLFSLGLVKP